MTDLPTTKTGQGMWPSPNDTVISMRGDFFRKMILAIEQEAAAMERDDTAIVTVNSLALALYRIIGDTVFDPQRTAELIIEYAKEASDD